MRERIAAIWRRAEAWLRRDAYVQAVVCEATRRAYLEGHAEGLMVGQRAGYQVGHAHGELAGRLALATELQIAHGVDVGGEKPMERDDVLNLKVRQLH
jgi:hypothetical protein